MNYELPESFYSYVFLHCGSFSIINFSSSPVPVASRSIEVSSPRLHYGRAAFYGSTIVPLPHHRVMQVPPTYQCSCSCQARRWIAALQQRDVSDWTFFNFQGTGHGDAFTTKDPQRTQKSDTLEKILLKARNAHGSVKTHGRTAIEGIC